MVAIGIFLHGGNPLEPWKEGQVDNIKGVSNAAGAMWSLQLDDYMTECGLDVTFKQFLGRFQALDKNIVREMSDAELLPMLGLTANA